MSPAFLPSSQWCQTGVKKPPDDSGPRPLRLSPGIQALSVEVPDIMEQTVHPPHALSDFPTKRIHEHNKIVAVLMPLGFVVVIQQ